MVLSELEETKEEGSFAATQQDGVVYNSRASKRAGDEMTTSCHTLFFVDGSAQNKIFGWIVELSLYLGHPLNDLFSIQNIE